MTPGVLERNLRALLRRSYVPALPAPHFRDRLESLFLNEVTRRVRRRTSVPRVLVALAAGLLALFLGWRFLAGDAPLTRERLLARGAVALGLPDGSWRAADAAERAHGLAFVPPALVAATPARGGFDVLLAAGSVRLDERSEVAFERRGAEDYATLHTGAARFVSGQAVEELEAGAAHRLVPPAPAEAPLAQGVPAGAREAMPGAPAPAPAAAAAARALAGVVVDAATGAPIADFTVALLRERVSHAAQPPQVRAYRAEPPGAFRWEDPPAGKQRVFVHAAGYALCALGEHDLALEPAPLRAELVRGVSVRGSVLDAAGAPVADALLLSEQDSPTDGLFLAETERFYWLPIQARSGPDGRFELAHLAPGRHTLRASAAGYATAWRETSAPAADEPTFVLGHGGTIEGTVTRDDGTPWAAAEIVVATMDDAMARRTNYALARTDESGTYRVEHLPAATLVVVLMRSDERPDVRPVQLAEGATARADFGPVEHGLTLSGRVLRADGTPLAGQNLGLFDRVEASWNEQWVASTTRADGGYDFPGVSPGGYSLFLIDELGRGLRCVDEVDVPDGPGEVAHDVRLPDGRLTVTVFDAGTLEPEANAVLVVMRAEPGLSETFAAYGITGADGVLALTDLCPGTYAVTAYPTTLGLGFASSERVEVIEGRATALELGLEPGGAVTVRVRSTDGRALENARVTFTDESGAEHAFSRLPLTDADGRYRAAGLRPGRYRVYAGLEGYRPATVDFRFTPGLEPEIPVLLAPLPPR